MKKYTIITLALVLSVLIGVGIVRANVSRIVTTTACSTLTASSTAAGGPVTSTASTSPIYLGAGLATTTLTCNLGTMSTGVDNLDSAVMGIQLTATSTGTTLNWRYEYSQDGVDWYVENIATTTNLTSVSPLNTYNWTYASSTINCGAGASSGITNNHQCKLVSVPTPTRWVRVIFSLPIGSLNGAVWAQIIGKSEIPQK